LRDPSIAVRPSFVTPSNNAGIHATINHDAGVETAVALSSVPAWPYAGPLLTSTSIEVNGVWRVQGFASVDPNPPRQLVPCYH
jgi:hypothetical protein